MGGGGRLTERGSTVNKNHPYKSVVFDNEALKELVVPKCAQHWEEVSVNTCQLTHNVIIIDQPQHIAVQL